MLLHSCLLEIVLLCCCVVITNLTDLQPITGVIMLEVRFFDDFWKWRGGGLGHSWHFVCHLPVIVELHHCFQVAFLGLKHPMGDTVSYDARHSIGGFGHGEQAASYNKC